MCVGGGGGGGRIPISQYEEEVVCVCVCVCVCVSVNMHGVEEVVCVWGREGVGVPIRQYFFCCCQS